MRSNKNQRTKKRKRRIMERTILFGEIERDRHRERDRQTDRATERVRSITSLRLCATERARTREREREGYLKRK